MPGGGVAAGTLGAVDGGVSHGSVSHGTPGSVGGGVVADVVGVGVVGVLGVVGVVGIVVDGSSRTLVRGTQVKSGSGTNPGGTTSVAGACTTCGRGS
jgi:hypothetical protein